MSQTSPIQPKLNDSWDLQTDGKGNLAFCSGAYARVQEVVNECRLLKGEAWWDTRQGIPWATEILANSNTSMGMGMGMGRSAGGKTNGKANILLRGAALGVDGVEGVDITSNFSRPTRTLSASLLITTNGEVYEAVF